jgi:hypothetical protein
MAARARPCYASGMIDEPIDARLEAEMAAARTLLRTSPARCICQTVWPRQMRRQRRTRC